MEPKDADEQDEIYPIDFLELVWGSDNNADTKPIFQDEKKEVKHETKTGTSETSFKYIFCRKCNFRYYI